MKNIYRLILSILPPTALIILGFIVSARADAFSEQQLHIVYYAPYVILISAVVLSWRFSRSRSFFITIILLAGYYAVNYRGKAVIDPNITFTVLSLLLPINIVMFSLLKERGIISLWGMLRFAAVLFQAWFIYWLSVDYAATSHYIFPVFLTSFIILAIRIILYCSSQDVYFLCVLITVFIMFSEGHDVEYNIFACAAGMMLLISVLKDTYSMAFYDDLTGLPSRRSLNQDLMKLGTRYTIAMLDIDFFKRFNDNYGHDTGDEALKFAAAMIKGVKCGGKAYRYGGEEFTILFPGKNLNEVMPELEELRKTIADKEFVIRRKRRADYGAKRKSSLIAGRNKAKSGTKSTSIHISIGAAEKNDKYKLPDLVLKAADSALYRAKKKGRNRVSK